jgi:hypothetical protein
MCQFCHGRKRKSAIFVSVTRISLGTWCLCRRHKTQGAPCHCTPDPFYLIRGSQSQPALRLVISHHTHNLRISTPSGRYRHLQTSVSYHPTASPLPSIRCTMLSQPSTTLDHPVLYAHSSKSESLRVAVRNDAATSSIGYPHLRHTTARCDAREK